MTQGGEGTDFFDNDQRGPLLSRSRSSEESLLRRKDNHEVKLSDEDDNSDSEDEGHEDVGRSSYKTPTSERFKLGSMSVFYSKGVFPTSLGMINSDNE